MHEESVTEEVLDSCCVLLCGRRSGRFYRVLYQGLFHIGIGVSTVVTTLLVTRRGFGWNSLINTNYIIFKTVENFKNKIKFPEIFFWKENKGLDGIFGTISFVEMNLSKLINYLTNMFQIGPCTRVVPTWRIF
jgi:hypothetical protein